MNVKEKTEKVDKGIPNMVPPPPMQPISAQKTCMKRLRNLMKEYNTLEEAEEKLLGMLDHVRQEERYLVRALHDDIETNTEIIEQDESSPTKEPTPASQVLNEDLQPEKEAKIEKSSSQHNAIQSNEEHDTQEGGTEQMETTAATTTADDTMADAATRPTKRFRRGRARAVMDKETEAKKRGQEMEQQRLARQRLENALFADDDEDDDGSSSTSS